MFPAPIESRALLAIRLIRVNRPTMLFQRRISIIALVTVSANERKRIPVNHEPVLPQLDWLPECLRAIGTLEGTLASVGPNMRIEPVLRTANLIAVLTREEFVAAGTLR